MLRIGSHPVERNKNTVMIQKAKIQNVQLVPISQNVIRPTTKIKYTYFEIPMTSLQLK